MAAAAIVKNHKNLVPAHFYPCFRRPFIPFAPFTLLFHFRFLLSLLFALFPFPRFPYFPIYSGFSFPFYTLPPRILSIFFSFATGMDEYGVLPVLQSLGTAYVIWV